MTLTEIIDGLRTPNSYAGDMAVQGAITHLEPHTQPITPEGLQARGFVWDMAYGLWLYRNVGPHEFILAWSETDGMRRWTPRAGDTSGFPGVRTLGDVDDLVRMLEGGE